MYLLDINFQNHTIVNLVKDALKSKEIYPPRNRPHLEARAQFKHDEHGNMIFATDQMKDKFLEISRRLGRATALHGPRVNSFTQYSLSAELEKNIIDELPNKLSSLGPDIAVQVIKGGKACTPHKDHSKQCSMFYLLTESDVKTTWWQPTSEFEEFQDCRYADPDKIEPVLTEVIEKEKWYIFNNDEYHSIHALGDKDIYRIALLIEFNIPAAELYKLLNND